MKNSLSLRKSLMSSVMAFALGVTGTVALTGAAANSQPTEPPVMQEAKPHLKAPNRSFIQQLSFADLVEEVSPAVVSIRTETTVPVRRRMGLPEEFERMLPEEFRGFGESDEGEDTRRAISQGSGFFVDGDGHIVTNNHVVDGAESIFIMTHDGQELEATLVGTDPSTDIAVLKVEPTKGQRFVRFSTDADLRVGDYVLAVGNPFGLGGSVTSGIVSALGREDRTRRSPYADFIQIDASINRGNSGGPTFDLRGNVVGVNTAIISPTGGNVGIGLAVPSDVASDIVRQLIEEGAVTRGWLGVTIGDLDDRLASAVELKEAKGALIQNVQEDSPAAKGGFKDGDVVLEFNGTKIESASGLTRTVGALPPGKTVKATVYRDGTEKTLTVTLAKRDPVEAKQAGGDEMDGVPKAEEMDLDLGVTFSSLTDAMRERLGLEEGVQGVLITEVDRTSEAAEAGIREGMVVTRADNKPVGSAKDIEKAVKAAQARNKEAVLIRVQTAREGSYFLALPVNKDDRG